MSLSARDKSHLQPRIQSGVVPYRYNMETGEIEILMIRTKHANNWGLPKGGWEEHLTLVASALKEADEEAGALGTPEDLIGTSEYVKGKTGRDQHVTWYLMHVRKLKTNYMEATTRDRKWVPIDKAMRKIDKGFRPILKRALKILHKRY
ncbi:putative NUDIX domain-containing protein [Erwinia phage vB_EamM_Yoloswag]|uniref:Putative NUDIX domain-containing protein n=1 Tax=Erwinia phage vB_EamM_Yoloswag TaxID=1958956 RepID=A0A1S6L341_9CAUD|nr:nudix hydrolase [Erwinia phage vB_EamM_Yoloswag]AQT28598.1 putative NUDIX domain-containing protein [Erwinia phage vB_EamM_Yoloswag]